MNNIVTLGEFIIERQTDFPGAKGELSRLLSAVRLAAKIVNREVNKAGLVEFILGSSGQENIQGEDQQKLDVYANEQFIQALKAQGEICGVGSEENDTYIAFESETAKKGKYVVLMDPLDGSSNIDVNVSIGTIFSIFRRRSEPGELAQMEDFLQKGTEQIAAGYVIYGSSTMLVYTTGNGVNGFTFDSSIGVFCLSHSNMRFPDTAKVYSVNESNSNDFPKGLQEFVKYCKSNDNEYGKPLTARYIGSLVADFHRNLIKGGVYVYPAVPTAPEGKLRLQYECNPLAFLAEQAGGVASDGYRRIMEIEPTDLHQRTPYFVGSKELVERAVDLMKEHSPEAT